VSPSGQQASDFLPQAFGRERPWHDVNAVRIRNCDLGIIVGNDD
jgi:hypothetical protein